MVKKILCLLKKVLPQTVTAEVKYHNGVYHVHVYEHSIVGDALVTIVSSASKDEAIAITAYRLMKIYGKIPCVHVSLSSHTA